MPERGDPNLDDVREALREHDERVEQNDAAEERSRRREKDRDEQDRGDRSDDAPD